MYTYAVVAQWVVSQKKTGFIGSPCLLPQSYVCLLSCMHWLKKCVYTYIYIYICICHG